MAETSITLTDTGKRRVSDSTANESVKANSGSAITLDITSLSYTIKPEINDESYRKYKSDDSDNEFDFPEVQKGSVGVPTWMAKGILDLSVSGDQNIMGYLVKAAKTKGYKELGTTDDASSTIMIRYSEDGGGVTSKAVRIASLQFKQSPTSSKVVWTLEMRETT